MSILGSAKDFRGLNSLTYSELNKLSCEIREMILHVTLKNGGHLASSLGAVELTVALLRAFDPDRDKIIFDVGHQSYAYKILTKRLDRFHTLRTKGGIAGFPRMGESPYDFFTTGHSSTSISAAMGYAKARDISRQNHEVVAVIGDGALLNGVSFEALNCVESTKTKIIIVLNDNKMSINPRIGGMAGHLARLSVNPTYLKVKDFIKDQCHTLKRGDALEDALKKIKSKLKSLLLPTNIFEELGISYWGPFDGHNIEEMEEVFRLARHYKEPVLIHVLTKKGKGCCEAENNAPFFHGIGPNTPLDAPQNHKQSSLPSWSEVMSGTLTDAACNDPRIAVCTAAMTDGTKLNGFADKFPGRFFDVGIAEEHMLTFAAGMAAGGMRPAVCIYSTFLQRAADQVMHDICLSKLPVLLGIDRAGLVGEDGETHHGLLDVPWLRALPGITIAAPRDAADLKFFVNGWLKRESPMAVRYPRGKAPEAIPAEGSQERIPAGWGKIELMAGGKNVCLIGVGSTVELMLKTAEKLRAEEGITPTVVDLRFIKPLDMDGISEILKEHRIVVTAEENFLNGGSGKAISDHACNNHPNCTVINIGVPDRYISHATRSEQWTECGLTPENIISAIKRSK
ncbi:MAG: 1-deoxy-D-xylulose-5-phosphate synthase [Synergistaceae bacterium]|jgi:1-deoxy-D-xylulose-5-phosphate synthase|nr:1-deoxy-D-xylulose-5-phosphate synthase [Synergistaceae bacterium]MBP9975969.1 1-deoxy-D-xylulose-5-phosphate synthase [Synergistaceae bacterium]MCE5183448.1 1-deoxy-D-xylulose-5-phosphate synthase [Synergistaceae bacterium]MDD4750298.1 1-deoxy-D-xylulose-5-phosphate synthase [Synergistaceae bacterium]MDD4837869.1 1-deoxy-D-xylulose-5-phosphate synthase [Synergistaceae bacterium]